jgi:hypothetical protein
VTQKPPEYAPARTAEKNTGRIHGSCSHSEYNRTHFGNTYQVCANIHSP